MNGILQTEAYVLGGRIYPPSAILTKKEFKDPDRLIMLEKNMRNKGNGVYFGRDFRRNQPDNNMKTITDLNLSHILLSNDTEYSKQQRNYQIAMSDETDNKLSGRTSYSTKLRNPDGSGLLQYSDGFVACSPIPSAVHAKAISRLLSPTGKSSSVSPVSAVIPGGTPSFTSPTPTLRVELPPSIPASLLVPVPTGDLTTPTRLPNTTKFQGMNARQQTELLSSLGIKLTGVKNNTSTRQKAYSRYLKS